MKDFEILTDWEDKYTYIIDLGKNMSAYPEEYHDDKHLLDGCVSQMWLYYEWKGEGPTATLHLWMDSDTVIVKGLCALVHAAYNCQNSETILKTDMKKIFKQLDMQKHIFLNRRSSFASIDGRIKKIVKKANSSQKWKEFLG